MQAITFTMESAASGTEFVPMPLLMVKDESNDGSEIGESLNSSSLIAEVDPMNLLHPVAESEMCDTLPDSECSSDNIISKETWDKWTSQHPWLLQDSDYYGYCLYCNVKISFKNIKNPIHHSRRPQHRENEDNYLAFKANEQLMNMGSNTEEIKSEFINLSEIRYKRTSQNEDILNLAWPRWQERHPWLLRDGNDPIHGFCKVCKSRLNVEFSYMRIRHEEGIKHKAAQKGYDEMPEYMRNDELGSSSEQEEETRSDNENEENPDEADGKEVQKSTPKQSEKKLSFKSPWYERVKNDPPTCRCKLCDVKMICANFKRHLRSKLHHDSEIMFKNSKTNSVLDSKKEIFRQRNWLVDDPHNPRVSYCKYCKKHFCASKSIMHQRGINHIRAANLYKRRLANAKKKGNNHRQAEGENSQDNVEQNETPETDTENSDSDSDGESESNTSRTVRFCKGSDEWIKQYPWCAKYKSDSSHFYFCTYCNIKLKNSVSRMKHEQTQRHQEATKQLNNKNSDANAAVGPKKEGKRIVHYPWLVSYKNNLKYVYCKYCRIRFSSSVSNSEHEKTKSHIEAAAKFTDTSEKRKESDKENLHGPSRHKPMVHNHNQRTMRAKIAMWSLRFPWLISQRSEVKPNYGFCKYCEMRIYTPTEKYALRHQKTMKHMRLRANSIGSVAKKPVYNYDWNHLQEKYPWLSPDKRNQKYYGYCKYCEIRLNITGVFKDRHQVTIKHSKAKEEYLKKMANNGKQKDDKQKDDKQKDEQQKGDQQKDKPPENTEVINIDDDNDCISVKSEPRNDDDVLEYLLHHAGGLNNGVNESEANGSPCKRRKVSDNQLIERAKRLTSAHLDLIRLSRNANELNSKRSNERLSLPSHILNTSAAIAALLSPPKESLPSTSRAPPPTQHVPAPRNNFELFFDSVCESVKSLPVDLAAEGKIKIMQLVADLELRALQRSHSTDIQRNPIQMNLMASTTRQSPSPACATDVPSTTTNNSDIDNTPPTYSQRVSSQTLDSTSGNSPPQLTPMPRHSGSMDNRIRGIFTKDNNCKRFEDARSRFSSNAHGINDNNQPTESLQNNSRGNDDCIQFNRMPLEMGHRRLYIPVRGMQNTKQSAANSTTNHMREA